MTLDFGKFKILFLNIFLILLKATSLNPYKLQRELKDVEYTVHGDSDFQHRVLLILISLYLEIKFVVGYITLAANVIAVFPILTNDLPRLLLPALFAQTIDHIVLNLIELTLAFYATKILVLQYMSVFFVLLTSKLIHITFAISALNIYSDYYQQLNFMPLELELSESIIHTQETLIRSQPLH